MTKRIITIVLTNAFLFFDKCYSSIDKEVVTNSNFTVSDNIKNETNRLNILMRIGNSGEFNKTTFGVLLDEFETLMKKSQSTARGDLFLEIGLQTEFLAKAVAIWSGKPELQDEEISTKLSEMAHLLQGHIDKFRIADYTRPDVTMNVPPPPGVSGAAGGDPNVVLDSKQREAWQEAIQANKKNKEEILLQKTLNDNVLLVRSILNNIKTVNDKKHHER
jgi:hypothetical protein